MEQPALDMDVRQLEKLNVLEDETSPNLVAQMAQGFLERVPTRLALMRQLLAAGNASQLANEAHGLATSSGMFGMMRMRAHCKALENLARAEGTPNAEPLLLQVEQAFAKARPLLMAQLHLQE